jgi:RNA polymerase sigma-70 factor (ECF subfamily)
MERGLYGEMEEREIVAGCLAGAAGADRAMIEAFGPLILAVALNVLGNKEDAEDVFQETFISVFRNLDRYDPERSFKTWLLTR